MEEYRVTNKNGEENDATRLILPPTKGNLQSQEWFRSYYESLYATKLENVKEMDII